jgi:hypothetical protein
MADDDEPTVYTPPTQEDIDYAESHAEEIEND